MTGLSGFAPAIGGLLLLGGGLLYVHMLKRQLRRGRKAHPAE